jgi:hypothetical protein
MVGLSLFCSSTLDYHNGFGVNKALTDWRIRTMTVKAPRTVPKGMKTHSTQAMTKQNV